MATVIASLWFALDRQRAISDQVQRQIDGVEGMLAAMVDQESGVRGFIQTREEEFLEPFVTGRRAFETWAGVADRGSRGDQEIDYAFVVQLRAAQAWEREADDVVDALHREPGLEVTSADAERRKELMDRFRTTNAALHRAVEADGQRRLDRGNWLATGSIVGVAMVFGVLGLVLVERAARRVARRRRDDAEFTQALQGADDETEAQELLKRHVERSVPRAAIVVLTRSKAGDRLHARTGGAAPAVGEALESASPRDCLAVRRGAPIEHGRRVPLQVCGICGAGDGASLCVPTLVGGEVIGTVLAQSARPLAPEERRRVEDAVGQAAPVMANLRNLAVAERRASTDGLTGLANARAVQEALPRMLAQAGRQASRVSAVLLDLDHFKSINDTHGHQAGDDALAAVGQLLRRIVRTSDLAGRWGGEEFVLLLPDTDSAGAAILAEKVRTAIAELIVPGLPVPVTASFGVASYPEHAGSGTDLVRAADTALYAAKHAGRDRVVVAPSERDAIQA
jgi:diguanylate cyclase (GGDEF)-like protein